MRNSNLQSVINDISLLIKLVFLKKNISTYELAKRFFDVKNRYELKKKDIFVRKFFDRWNRYGVINYSELNGKKYYTINKDNVIIGDSIDLLDFFKDLGAVFCINYNGWIIFQITDNILKTKH